VTRRASLGRRTSFRKHRPRRTTPAPASPAQQAPSNRLGSNRLRSNRLRIQHAPGPTGSVQPGSGPNRLRSKARSNSSVQQVRSNRLPVQQAPSQVRSNQLRPRDDRSSLCPPETRSGLCGSRWKDRGRVVSADRMNPARGRSPSTATPEELTRLERARLSAGGIAPHSREEASGSLPTSWMSSIEGAGVQTGAPPTRDDVR